jgi:hypothetical protein
MTIITYKLNGIRYLAFTLFLLTGCSNKETNPCSIFTEETKVYSEKIEFKDSIVFFRPFLLEYVDSNIISTDVFENKMFTAVNLSTKEVFRFGYIGNGPGEFLIGTFCSRFKDSKFLSFYNSPNKSYYKMSIDSISGNHNIRPAKSIKFNSDVRKLNVLNDSLFITENSFGDYRLSLYNEKGDLLHSFLQYPLTDGIKSSKNLSMIYQGKFSINPDLLRFAYIIYNSSNIGIYEIKDRKINVVKEIFLQGPLKTLNSLDGFNVCIPNEDCKIGYIDVYSTKKFIYALYNDDVVLNNASVSSDVLVFNWDGTPVRILRLDKKASFICVSDNDSILYAINSEKEETNILFFKL